MLKNQLRQYLAAPHREQLPDRVLVYGGGSMGRGVARFLRTQGIKPLALLDRHAASLAPEQGLPICTAQDWGTPAERAETAVVLAIHNPGHRMADLVADLKSWGYESLITLIDLCNLFPDQFDNGFWLAPRSLYAQHLEQLIALNAMLADQASRDTLHNVLRFRITGDYLALEPPEGSQYCPVSLPRWSAPMRLVDCGAYDGDTLDAFGAAGYAMEQVVCFEPDPRNFGKIAAKVRAEGIPATCIPCAVSDQTQMLRFSAQGSGASHVSSDGEILIQAVQLDQALPNFRPNLIKMDVEGAEPQALLGAEQTIRSARPGLAICLYHRPEQLWQIPLLLREWLPDYSFSIRSHAHNSFDLVLYGRPN